MIGIRQRLDAGSGVAEQWAEESGFACNRSNTSGLLCKMCVQTHRCNLAKLGKLLVMFLCAIVCNRCGTLTSLSTLRG